MVTKPTFGRMLRGKRTVRGLTQRELAELAGVDASYISQLERDHRSPSPRTLANLAQALGVEVGTLLAEYVPRPFDEEETSVFVGRADVLEAFDRELAGGTAGVLTLEGGPGSGRTHLIRGRLAPACRDAGAPYAYVDGDRLPGYPELLAELRERFSAPGVSYAGFDEIYSRCLETERKIRGRFNDPFGVPVSPRPGEEPRAAGLDELTHAEKYIYRDMERLLTVEFIGAFEQFVAGFPKTVIFIDDFDHLGSLTGYWFCELLAGLGGARLIGRRVLAVLAGERRLRLGAALANVKPLKLRAFDAEETLEYARAKGLATDGAAAGELLALGGHPLSVALWTEYFTAEALYRENKLGDARAVLEKLSSRMAPSEKAGAIRAGDLLMARVNRMLGHLLRFEGKLARADEHYALAAELFEKTGDAHKTEFGYVLLDRGNVSRHLGLWDEALGYYRQAGRVFAETMDELGGAVARTSTGTVFRLRGEFGAAKTEYLAAERALRENLKGASEGREVASWLANTLSSLSITYRLEAEALSLKGDGKAERTLKRAEKLSEHAINLGADRAETAVAKNRLALCYQARGAAIGADEKPPEAMSFFDKAEALHREALATFEDIGDKYRVAQVLADLGAVAELKGARHDAVLHLKNSLALFRQLGSGYHIAKVLLNLGHLAQGDERLGYFSEALAAAYGHNAESFEETTKAVLRAMENFPSERDKLFADLGPEYERKYRKLMGRRSVQ